MGETRSADVARRRPWGAVVSQVAVRDALAQHLERRAVPGERLAVQFVGAQRQSVRLGRTRTLVLLAGIGGIVGLTTRLAMSPLLALTLVIYLILFLAWGFNRAVRRGAGMAAVGITDRRVLIVRADGTQEPKVLAEWPREQLLDVTVDVDAGSWAPRRSFLRMRLASSPPVELVASGVGAVAGVSALLRMAGVRVLDGSGAAVEPPIWTGAPLVPPPWPSSGARLRSCMVMSAVLVGALLMGLWAGDLVGSLDVGGPPRREVRQCEDAVEQAAGAAGLRVDSVRTVRSNTSAQYSGAFLATSPDGAVSAVEFSCHRAATGMYAVLGS